MASLTIFSIQDTFSNNSIILHHEQDNIYEYISLSHFLYPKRTSMHFVSFIRCQCLIMATNSNMLEHVKKNYT